MKSFDKLNFLTKRSKKLKIIIELAAVPKMLGQLEDTSGYLDL